jgi:hypothetical protein
LTNEFLKVFKITKKNQNIVAFLKKTIF